MDLASLVCPKIRPAIRHFPQELETFLHFIYKFCAKRYNASMLAGGSRRTGGDKSEKESHGHMKKRTILLSLLLCLAAGLLSGCGGSGDAETASDPASDAGPAVRTSAADPAETALPTPEALQEYAAEGVGTFWLPEGFDLVCQQTQDPLPMHSATFTRGDVTVYASRFGTDAYEAAGVPMPADLTDFSTRDGVRKDIPEDAQFATDDLGNMYVDWIDSDGLTVYYVLKSGDQSYGSVIGYCPEDDPAVSQIPLWISKAVLD